ARGAPTATASAAIRPLRTAMTPAPPLYARRLWSSCALRAVAGPGPRRPRRASDRRARCRPSRGWGPAGRGAPLIEWRLMASLTERPATPVRAPRGTELSCQGWPQEAALRMLMNNLDTDVAERWEDLVVYGGSGKAARSWEAYHTIVRTLRRLGGDETLL